MRQTYLCILCWSSIEQGTLLSHPHKHWTVVKCSHTFYVGSFSSEDCFLNPCKVVKHFFNPLKQYLLLCTKQKKVLMFDVIPEK